MLNESIDQMIDFLLRREFGSLAPPPLNTRTTSSSKDRIQERRSEYRAMTLERLRQEVEAARSADIEELKSRAIEEEQALFFNQPHANADFGFWGKMALWNLDEAVALSLGKNPSVVNWNSVNGSGDSYIRVSLKNSPFRREYAKRRELVVRAEAAYELSESIKPNEFLAWALRTFDSVPDELIGQVRARGERVDDLASLAARVRELEDQMKGSTGSILGKWPWGDHETKLLRHLAAAGERFWKNYDPGDPSTASTNEVIASWLMDQGVPKRVAEVMAQILRVDGLKPGPR